MMGAMLGMLTCGLVSCEDKAMAVRISVQKAEIEALQSEAGRLRDELGEEPEGNPTADLKKAEAELAAVKSEIAALELKKEELEESRDDLQKQFSSYKRKYRVSE